MEMMEKRGELARPLRIRFVLPRLIEAGDRCRSIKYSLFPPLGLATLAGYLKADDEADIVDEHVEPLDYDSRELDVVAIEVYVTCAKRAYQIADEYRRRGVHVVMGGVHTTACPEEVLLHADTLVMGPAEEAFPRFLDDFRKRCAQKAYTSQVRSLEPFPSPRRDLIKRRNYLVPNCVSISRGCPHTCDFCYKTSFYAGGKSYYRAALEQAVAEVDSLDGKYVFFVDDNLLADERFCFDFFREIAPMRKVWQAVATVQSLKNRRLLDAAVQAGAGSFFVGFETINAQSVRLHGKTHNDCSDYGDVIEAVHSCGAMINASFIYGLESDDGSAFPRTVEWAVRMGVETATFHILTPYPGSALFSRYKDEGRILTEDWNLYDTRHCVFKHPLMSPEQIEAGYWQSYRDFYSWKSIFKSLDANPAVLNKCRHLLYTGAWKKMDPVWNLLIAMKRLPTATPVLRSILRSSRRNAASADCVQMRGELE